MHDVKVSQRQGWFICSQCLSNDSKTRSQRSTGDMQINSLSMHTSLYCL